MPKATIKISEGTKRLASIHVVYFKTNGTFYSEAKFEDSFRYDKHGSIYMHDAVAKVRGWRNNGGQGSLPGLMDVWDGFILVNCEDGYPCLILPLESE